MNAFPWRTLRKPLAPRDRARLRTWLAAMLRWQRTLGHWPRPPVAPDATPFVTLYEHGRVRGCVGFAAGDPAERPVRAFLNALADARFAGANERTRETLVAQLSYAIAPRVVALDAFVDEFEPGTDGAVFVPTGAPAAVLLPQVARDGHLDAKGFLDALARKARTDRDGLARGTIHLFAADGVASRGSDARDRGESSDLAAAWLARQVTRDGSIRFAVDPHTGADLGRGTMYHGRAATLLHALAAHGGHDRVVTRARRWLTREIENAFAARPVAAWPEDPAMVAGTLALAVRAGLDVRERLVKFVRETHTAQKSAWHSAQVVAALGRDAPREAFALCARDLTARPFAPWTVLAARAVGDAAVVERSERALVDSIRRDAPHRGGANVTVVPEIALTSIVVEALADSRDGAAKRAVVRAREFLRSWQLTGDRLPASLDPAVAEGAFPASPVNATLRCDITAHALLALEGRCPT